MIYAALALTLLLARLALLGAAHVVPSPYDPVRHAVSDYAIGPTRPLTTAMSLVTAVAWWALAAAAWQLLPAWSYMRPAVVMLVALGVLSVLVVAAPTDLEGERRTPRGLLHYGVAIASFALAYSLTGDVTRLAEHLGWGPLAAALTVLHWIALVSLVLVCAGLAIPRVRAVFGLVERVFLVAIAVFYAVFAAGLLLT